MKHLAFIAVWVCLLSCGALGSEQGQQAQVTAARTAQEISCQKYIARFRDGADEGLTCQAAKRRAELDNPTCPLVFTCPPARELDGGAE